MHISDWSSDVCSSDLESLAAEPLRSLHGSWRGPSSLVRQMLPASRGIDRRHTVVTVAARVASPFLSQSKVGIVGRNRKSGVKGKSGSVSVDLGGRRGIKTKQT